jgi:hypothetical protein
MNLFLMWCLFCALVLALMYFLPEVGDYDNFDDWE